MEPSDRSLLNRARLGDEQAVRQLYRREAAAVYSVTRRILADEMLAEDAAQEAWVRALQGLEGFRGDASFSTWIHRIAVNCALQLQRRRLRSREDGPLEEAEPSATRAGPLFGLWLEGAIAALPERMRAVLVLHDVEGYTHQEIGELLGIADGTSKSQLSKARQRVRATLAESGLDSATLLAGAA